MNPLTWSPIRALWMLSLLMILSACGGASKDNTLPEAATANPALSTFTTALSFASENKDLVNALSGSDNFTVFAPTNAAFDALAVELLGTGKTAKDLLVPGNEAFMRSVLRYHIVAGTIPKSGIKLGHAIEPVLGGHAFFKVDKLSGATALFDGRGRAAGIETADLAAPNGVIHTLTKVMLPANQSIMAVAQDQPTLSTLVAAIQLASIHHDLVQTLSGAGALTVLAPTNAAFDALAEELLGAGKNAADLLVPGDESLIRTVLQYHVLGSRVLRADMLSGQSFDPILPGNAAFTVNASGNGLTVTDGRNRRANTTSTDLFATTGVVHVVDKVILPPQ